MPVTDTLKTATDLRQAGFTDVQATVLAAKFEESAHSVGEDLKSFISGELDRKLGDLDRKLGATESRLELKMSELRVELHSALRDQTLKLVAILIAGFSLAVAAIKLFPNLH